MKNYSQLKKENHADILEIRLKYKKDYHVVEFFDGIRINPETLPKGKHMYHTRHADNDCSTPITIAQEGKSITVNFCGTIVSEQKLDLSDETKLMFVNHYLGV